MAEYIEREKVYEMLNSLGGCGAEPESWADGWDKAIDTAIAELNKIPTADVRPIIHGKWIELPRTRISNLVDFKCSVCGGNMCMSDDCELEWCGRCGAKMDGKDV